MIGRPSPRVGFWVWLGWFLPLVAFAEQARDVKIVDVASAAVPATVHASHGFDPAESAGLFVGVRHFKDPAITEVPYAVDDAIDLAHLFSLELGLIPVERLTLCLAGEPEKPESKIRLKALAGARFCQPGLTELFDELGRLKTSSGPKGLVVVALASHGFSKGGHDALVAMDSKAHLLPTLGVPFATLLDQVERAGAPRRLVLVDACRERLTDTRALGQDPTTALGQGFIDAVERARGTAVLMGTVLGGYSYNDHDRKAGVFTAAVIDGLRGEAPADAAGLITVHQLATFVNDRVASWVQRTKPPGASKSPGITQMVGETSGSLPLTISPSTYKGLASYRLRRDAALDALGKWVLRRKITGSFFDEVTTALEPATPSPERLRLIDGIESVGDNELALRGLVGLFDDLRPALGGSSPPPNPAAVAVAPKQVEVAPGQAIERSIDVDPPGGDWMVEVAADMAFRFVPPGTFQMGSPASEKGRGSDETQHEVTLTQGFWMGETEVTQGQWRSLMGNNPSYFSQCGEDCPVEQVNWFEAITFANRVSELAELPLCYEIQDCSGSLGGGCNEGKGYCSGDYQCQVVEGPSSGCRGYRLPTEAEWEWAARTETPGAVYVNDLSSIAWYSANSSSATHSVGGKDSNVWGLHDMLGNVWEWAGDWYGAYPSDTQRNPVGPAKSSDRVLRGCSWSNSARDCRSADRGRGYPAYRVRNAGFRLVRTP